MAKKGRFSRIAKITGVGSRVGGSWLGQKVKGAFQGAKERAKGEREMQIEGAREVVKTMGALKGAAMKMGQSLAQVAEGMDLPEDVAASLRNLNDKAEPIPFSIIREDLEAELEAPIDELFSWIDPAPLGTASLAQAHAATLPDGTSVVVKVLHRQIEDAVAADLFALRSMFVTGRLMNRSKAELVDIFDEIEARLQEELDYYQEAANIEELRAHLAHFEGLRLPHTHPKWCTERVLTMDRLPGVSLEEFRKTASPEARDRAASIVAESFHHQLFVARVLHADPHEGNYLFEPDGTVSLLDFGCVKRFDEHWIGGYAQLAQDAFRGRRHETLEGLRDIGGLTSTDRGAEDIAWEIIRVMTKPFVGGEVTLGGEEDTAIDDLRALAPRYLRYRSVRVPKEMVYVHRTLTGVYSLGRRLGARADWGEIATRYHVRAIAIARGDQKT